MWFGSSLIVRTRPKSAPTRHAHWTRVGQISALVVQTPPLSGLPWSQKPAHSMAPNAEAMGAKLVSPPLFQSRYSSDSYSAAGISSSQGSRMT